MADVALQSGKAEKALDRAAALKKFQLPDVAFAALTKGSAIMVLVILGGVILSLIGGSWPALSTFG